jgi:hypothetical protein
MKQEIFEDIINNRYSHNLDTMTAKGKVYSSQQDRLSNFKDTGAMNQVTPQDALWGMVSKHIIATKDMVKSGEIPTEKWIAEYLGDIHNYMYLLEAIWHESSHE